jgi:hypothetical protein
VIANPISRGRVGEEGGIKTPFYPYAPSYTGTDALSGAYRRI